MGHPTSDDDATGAGRGPGPEGWGPPSQNPGGASAYPPPGQGPSAPPSEGWPRDQTAQFPQYGPGGAYPPGQGGYPPPRPGYPPPGQGYPGPYPPPGPGGPYGYGGPQGPGGPSGPGGPGGPAGDGGNGKRNVLIAVVAGIVLLAAVGVVLWLSLGGDADPVAGDSTTTAESRIGAPGATATTEQSPSPAPSPAPMETSGDVDYLLSVVPPDFTDCQEAPLEGDGDIAHVRCGPSTTQPGPQEAEFYLYEDTDVLDQVFAADVAAAGLEPMPEGEDCTTSTGVTTWDVADVQGGEVACAVTDDGVVIAWTDWEFGIEGVVYAPGSTQEELAELSNWWIANSDYQG